MTYAEPSPRGIPGVTPKSGTSEGLTAALFQATGAERAMVKAETERTAVKNFMLGWLEGEKWGLVKVNECKGVDQSRRWGASTQSGSTQYVPKLEREENPGA